MFENLDVRLRSLGLPLLGGNCIVVVVIRSLYAHDGTSEMPACGHKHGPRPSLFAAGLHLFQVREVI